MLVDITLRIELQFVIFFCVSHLQSAEKEIHYYGSLIKAQEDDLKWSVVRRSEITEDLRNLQG